MRTIQNLQLYLLGGIAYGLIELLWRGETHISMVLLGGLCFLVLRQIGRTLRGMSFLLQCVVGALAITGLEFICGCIVNLWMGLHVWDYSALPFNLFGQVCALYLALWIGLSGVALLLLNRLECRAANRVQPTGLQPGANSGGCAV